MFTTIQTSLIVFTIGLASGCFSTYKIMDWRSEANRVKAVERVIDQMSQQEKQNDEISTRFENNAVLTRTLYKTIYKDVAFSNLNPDCIIPSQWVRQWNQANTGEEAASKPDYSLPKATTLAK